MSGWIKIHRKILEWEWYEDSNTFRLFMHLILKSNHKDKKHRGIVVKTGSLLTGRELLSYETGLSVQQVRTCLERLKLTNEITINSSRQGTIIQIVKYKDYQITTNDVTTKQPQNNQQVTTNKNVKNERSIFIPPTVEEVSAYCLERNNDINPERFVDFYTSKGWVVGKNKMKDWKAAVRGWEKDSKESHKQPNTGYQKTKLEIEAERQMKLYGLYK